MLTFRVRRKRSGNDDPKHMTYKYSAKSYDWTLKEMQEVEGPFSFLFAPSMTPEDIAKVKEKWKHKLKGENNEK